MEAILQFLRITPPSSDGEAVFQIRKYRRRAILLMAMNILLIASTYLMLISPVFQSADVLNPAVNSYLLNPKTDALFAPYFDTLAKYNIHETDRLPVTQFGQSGNPQFGVTVNVMYKLSADESETGSAQKELTELPRKTYRYIPQISVLPSFSILVIVSLLELILLTIFVWLVFEKKPNAQLDAEERALRTYFDGNPVDLGATDQIARLKDILQNFDTFCIQLNRRRQGRAGMAIDDEYDVQDILHAILKLHFKDVSAEVVAPQFAGASSRMDFLLRNEEIAIEVKKTRRGLNDRQLGDELLIDVARYSTHEKCQHLIFFIYDPERRIENPQTFISDLANLEGNIKAEVVFSPVP